MKLRNIFILGLVVILIFALGNLALADKVKVIMVTDTAGLGDKSFNDSVWAGIEKAKKNLGIEAKVIESREMADIYLTLPGQLKMEQI